MNNVTRALIMGVPAAALACTALAAAPSAAATGHRPAAAGQAQAPAAPISGAALHTLRALASALGEQGRGAFADVYSNVVIDQPHQQVLLYATDPPRAARLVGAAAHAHPHLDIAKVRIIRSAYTKAALDARIAQIMAGTAKTRAADLTVYSAAAAPDGSGIQISAKPQAVGRLQAQLANTTAIPVTVTAGAPITAASWRWNDTLPFIGGDVLLGAAPRAGYRDQCTAGLAAEDAAGRDYLITADHCFPGGSLVYGEGDPVGNFGYNFGNYIGRVVSNSDYWDAEVIDTGYYNGAGTNSDEADQPQGKWIPVDSYAYSYDGDSVCQDGARSYYTGHGVPCGIVVWNQDITYNMTWDDGTVHTARGVLGENDTYAVTAGDSGGLVFTIDGTNTRQARGQVSASSGSNWIFWTEATNILGHFGLRLNPHQ